MAPETQQLPPPIEYPSRVEYPNLLTLNGEVFSLEPINCNLAQAVDAHHKFYKAQFEEYKQDQDRRTIELIEQDSIRDLGRLVEARQRGTIMIPTSQQGMPIKVMDGLVWEMRNVLYEPEEVKTNRDYMHQYCWPELSADHRRTIDGFRDANIVIVFRCPFKALIEFYFNDQDNTIKSDASTFHTLSERRLCTGNTLARQVWRNTERGAFATYINRINMFSMATAEISVVNLLTRRSETHHIRQVVNSNNIATIIAEERSTWTTS